MAALSVAEALDRILAGVEVLPSEAVPLANARARVLAADLAATLTQPPFDASAMDGYAVRGADVAVLPATLNVIGESAAGHGFHQPITRGQAVRIFTGAPLPPGADAIVIQENTRRDGDSVRVVDGRPDPDHVRPRGADFAFGAILMRAARVLDARALTLAAAMGHGTLPCVKPPVVAILATGDELVPPGTPPGRDQIVCSNPYGLAAMIEAAGGIPRFLGIAADTAEALADKLGEARGADILVTTGGASVGDHDLVAPVLQKEGMALDFWNIAMRPGKPLIFGRLGATRVLGLPGNPISSLICARVFLVPLMRALQGLDPQPKEGETAVAAVPLPANGPRQHYMRGVITRDAAGPPRVTPASSQDSFFLTPFAAADCLIVRPPRAAAVDAGTPVPILRIDY